jgi:2-hydroxy-6-oxonona-2,4-dienedioate hydrolase
MHDPRHRDAERESPVSSTWLNFMGAQIRHDGGKYKGRFAEAGSGEALILLHGQGGHIESFSRNLTVYGRHFHTFALDCVWHGYGPQPPFDEELLPTYVDQVLDFMDWQGIESAHIEGQSMGGWTAMRLAHDHPDRVKKLVLTTCQGFQVDVPGVPMEPAPNPAAMENQRKFLGDPNFENIRSRLKGLFARPELMPEEIVHIRQKIYSDPTINKSLTNVVTSYMGGPGSAPRKHVLSEEQLAEIKTPTLVYWGENNMVPPPIGERLAEIIPNARYYCSPVTGHWAQFENADDHNREVLRFLTGNDKLEPDAIE